MMDNSFTITSYFTVGTPYADVCHKYLFPSVRELQLQVDIRGVPNRGSWLKNTAYKPEFLRQMLDMHKSNIVFVDSDAEIKFYPEEFLRIPDDCCIAAHILDKNAWYGVQFDDKNRYELLSGTLFIRNCDESRRILAAWIVLCRASNIWEQRLLQTLVERDSIKVHQLPISYCYIKTLPNGKEPYVKVENPVIVHNQVSRKLKKVMGTG